MGAQLSPRNERLVPIIEDGHSGGLAFWATIWATVSTARREKALRPRWARWARWAAWVSWGWGAGRTGNAPTGAGGRVARHPRGNRFLAPIKQPIGHVGIFLAERRDLGVIDERQN